MGVIRGPSAKSGSAQCFRASAACRGSLPVFDIVERKREREREIRSSFDPTASHSLQK